MILKRLHEASRDMSFSEGLIKPVVAMFFVLLPILAGALGGFRLDYYKFDTLCTILGTRCYLGHVYGLHGGLSNNYLRT